MSTQIKRRKWNWIGHTLRKGNAAIETEALDWNRQGKRRRERPWHTWRKSVHNEALEKGKNWNEVKRMAGNRTRWRCFVDAPCPLRDNRNLWWWWWWIFPQVVIKFPTFYAAEVSIIAVTTPSQLFHPIPDISSYIFQSYSFKIQFNNIPPHLPRVLQRLFPSGFLRICMCYLLSCACHVFCSSQPPWFDNPKYLAKGADNEAFR